MTKREKILLALSFISFVLLVYLISASKKIDMPKNDSLNKENSNTEILVEKVDLTELENKYKNTVKGIFSQMENKINNFDPENRKIDQELRDIKNSLIAMVVPDEYRAFHLSLVMLLEEIDQNNYVIDTSIKEALNNISQNNSWLN